MAIKSETERQGLLAQRQGFEDEPMTRSVRLAGKSENMSIFIAT
jgi:hypothetical protein